MRNKLIKLRHKHKLTQAGLAEKLGVSKQVYINIERGRRNGDFDFWTNLGFLYDLDLKTLKALRDEK